MRVSRLIALAVVLCIVMQAIDARNLKFKTFGSSDLGGSTGTSGNTPPPTTSTTSGGDRSPTQSPSKAPSSTSGGTNTGPGGMTMAPTKSGYTMAPTRSGTSSGSPVDRPKEYTTGTLSNYTDKDEDSNKTDSTEANRDSQRTIASNTGYDFYFAGQAGLMKIQAPDSSNYVSVKFRKLCDSDGQKADNFENATWKWEGPTSVVRQGLQATVLTATGTITVETLKGIRALAKFHVEVLTFNESGTFQYGNETLFVDSTTAKISYNITGWPFANKNGSFLYLAVTVNAPGNGINSSASGQGITIGEASVSAPPLAYADGEATKIDLFFSKDSDDSTGCQGRVLMVFPQFANSLFYDPIISPFEVSTTTTTTTSEPTSAPTSTSSTSKGAMTSSFSMFAALLAVLLMLAF
jgi:hypothetical protein